MEAVRGDMLDSGSCVSGCAGVYGGGVYGGGVTGGGVKGGRGGGGGTADGSTGCAAPQFRQYGCVSPTRFPHWLQKGIYYSLRYASTICSSKHISAPAIRSC